MILSLLQKIEVSRLSSLCDVNNFQHARLLTHFACTLGEATRRGSIILEISLACNFVVGHCF